MAEASDEVLVRAEGLTKTYAGRAAAVTVFQNLDFAARRGELVAIVGASGTGKSTLLHLLGGLDQPTAGSVKIAEFDLQKNSTLDSARFRNRHIGFVFQHHHLLPEFSALENVMLPQLIGGVARRPAARRAQDLLARVGLAARADHRPGELSGGEQQRVALARALSLGPLLLLADEPTGNLDETTGRAVFNLIREIQRAENLTAILVTHNDRLAAECDRVLQLENGKLGVRFQVRGVSIHPDQSR